MNNSRPQRPSHTKSVSIPLVSCSCGVCSGGETETIVCGVEHAVETLKECVTINKVKTLSTV